MVESALTKRQQIFKNLIDLADKVDGDFDKLKVVHVDKNLNYEARQTWEGDGPVTVIRYDAEGFTKEDWLKWQADPIAVQCKLNDRLTATKLDDTPDLEGHATYHLAMKMPMVLSNRSIFTSFYQKENEDGSLILINSS